MKLISLHIENITSLREADIDFTGAPLRDSDIFLISGEIGAGKSTILDCICLALYNTTPRLSNWQSSGKDLFEEEEISEKSPQQLLSRGATHGLVSLVFDDAGGTRYKAEWSVKRARHKPDGRIQDEKRTLEYTKGGKTYLITNKNELKKQIPQIIGLDFQQFCRTSMLAQGDFTRFLNSRDDEKASILEKITGTDIYSRIGVAIARKISEAEAAKNAIEAKISDTRTLSEEEIRELESHRTELSSQRKRIDDELEEKRKILARLSQYRSVNDAIEDAHTKAKEYGEILASLSPNLEECRRVLKRKKGDLKELSELMRRLSLNRKLYEQANAICQLIGSILDTQERITETSARIAKGEKGLKEFQEKTLIPAGRVAKEKVEALKQSVRNASQINDELDEMQPDRIRKQYIELTEQKLLMMNCGNSMSNLHTEIEERRKTQLDIESQRTEMTARSAQWETEKTNRDTAEATYVQSQRLLETARQATADTVKAVRSRLKTGDMCPVCDRRITDNLPTDDELEERLRPLQEAVTASKENFDNLAATARESNVRILTLKGSIERAEGRLKDTSRLEEFIAKAKDDAVKAELPESYVAAIDSEKTYEEAVSYLTVRLTELDKQIEALDKQLAAIKERQENLKKANREVDTCRAEVEAAREKLTRHTIKESSLKADLTLRRSMLKESRANELRYNNELDEALESVGYTQEIESLAEFKKRLSKEAVKYHESEIRLKQLGTEYAAENNVAERCSELLERCRFRYPEEYLTHTPAEGDVDISELHERIATFITDVKTFCDDLRTKIKERKSLRKEIREKEIPDIEQYESGITERANRISDIDKQLGQVKEKLESNSRVCGSISELITKRKEAEATLLRWHRLTDLADMQGKRFKRIAQSYVLGSLVAVANDYLNRLSGRYRLTHAPGTFTLYVQDSWDGFVNRPASTISGGESFLVSLSLALALTDFAGSFHVDILFIDEGFGSLNGEALTKAVNVLRDLHSISGRRVGIISHIESLKNEIPVKIYIERHGTSTASTLRLMPEI